jgi:hypothetical protein
VDTAPKPITAPSTLRIMSDDFGKIAAILLIGPWRRTDAWFPGFPHTSVNLGFYSFYHDRITSATGAIILV